MESKKLEQTLILIKPDALKLSLTGYILSQLSEFHSGLRIAGAKIVHVHRMLAEEHYIEHIGKPFYPSLISYIIGQIHYADSPQNRRVVAMIYCGPDAVKKIRDISGPTNPHIARETAPGTIRALGTIVSANDASNKEKSDRMDNLIHASASNNEAQREIKLWFKPNDIMPHMHAYETEMATEHYYFKEQKLYTSYIPGSICLLAPGDTAWKSDLDALRQIAQGKPAACSLNAVVVKYQINERFA